MHFPRVGTVLCHEAGLAGHTTTTNIDLHIELAHGFRGLERLEDLVATRGAAKVLIDLAAIDAELSGAFGEINTGNG